jgi:hypothetical protein
MRLNHEPEMRRDAIHVLDSLYLSLNILPSSWTPQGGDEVTGVKHLTTEGLYEVWQGTCGTKEVRAEVMDKDKWEAEVKEVCFVYHPQSPHKADQYLLDSVPGDVPLEVLAT